MFELLFKYPQSVWQNAELVFESRWPISYLIAIAVLGALVLLFFLVRNPLKPLQKMSLALLQLSLLSIALFMLWRPALLSEQMVPGENTVSYLLDTSKSMATADVSGRTRIDAAKALLQTDSLTNSDWFEAHTFSVASELAPIESTQNLQADAAQSALLDGVSEVLDTVSDTTLAAVVLLSDGANNVGTIDSDWWQRVKSAGVPIHTVGLGETLRINDIELQDVSIDDLANDNSPVSARLLITHNGIERARVRVHQGTQLLHAQNIVLDGARNESIHSIDISSGDAGVRELRFTVEALDANDQPIQETDTSNNVQTRIQRVENQPKRILYVEGEPRWEYKFIRRALSEHSEVNVVSLLRTSSNKFFRQGVANARELADGFPTQRDELFAYDAIIIGSLNAAELSTEQQVNLRDFVSLRGGSLLMLAGRDGLSDGGWGRSVVASTLPGTLSPRLNGASYRRERATVSLTLQGERTPWLKLEAGDAQSNAAWQQLPEIADWQRIGDIKPGASTLLELEAIEGKEPLLLWHRYGQGNSAILASSGTWRWQMRLPSENQWHQKFWQQLLSQMVNTSLPRISIELDKQVYRDQSSVEVAVIAREANFDPVLAGELQAVLVAPSGKESDITLSADVNTAGRFIGSVSTVEPGPYSIRVEAEPRGEAMVNNGSAMASRWWIKEQGTAETFGNVQQAPFLKRLAEVTGGQYLSLANADQLVDVLSLQNAGVTREQYLPVWNIPFLFLLLVLGKCLEWFLRLRWKRL